LDIIIFDFWHLSKNEFWAYKEEISKLNINSLINLDNDTLNSSFSLAVVNEDYFSQGGISQSMESYLLLDSELKGSLESPANYFIDNGTYYLKVVKGNEQTIRIVGSAITAFAGTSSAYTVLVLNNWLEDVTPDDFNVKHTGVDYNETLVWNNTGNLAPSSMMLFSVIKTDSAHIISEKAIQQIYDNPILTRWDEDLKKYYDIGFLAENYTTGIDNNLKRPNIVIKTNRSTIDGDISYFVPIKPEIIEYVNHTFTNVVPGHAFTVASAKDNLIDRNRSTYVEFRLNPLNGQGYLEYYVKFPENIALDSMDSLYLCFDAEYETDLISAWEVTALAPPLTSPFNRYGPVTTSIYPEKAPSPYIQNFIPNEYYAGIDISTDQSNFYGRYVDSTDINSLFKISEDVISNIQATKAAAIFSIRFKYGAGIVALSSTIKIKQIAFVAKYSVNRNSDKLFMKVKGEIYD
jgi:hypothetical protein